jgi:hypothetical protein
MKQEEEQELVIAPQPCTLGSPTTAGKADRMMKTL